MAAQWPTETFGDVEPHWEPRSAAPPLSPGEVHLWVTSLTIAPEALQAYEPTLGPEELERANRFRYPIHRTRFIASHGILRHILASYLDTRPETLSFSYAPAGKPFLTGIPDFHFNMAHSGDAALIGIAHCPLGVDLEQTVASVPELLQIARSYFAPDEYARLIALPEAERPQAFLRCWTRKEAFLKTDGEGIANGLHSFEVTFEPDVEARVITGAKPGGSLHHLRPAEGYVGAVHLLHTNPFLRRFRFSPPPALGSHLAESVSAAVPGPAAGASSR